VIRDRPTRRTVLATLGSACTLSLAGCGGSTTDDLLAPGTSAAVDAGTVTVEAIAARRQYRYRQAGVHPSPAGAAGTVFVLATVSVEGFDAEDPRPGERLSLALDGDPASQATHRPMPAEGTPRFAWAVSEGTSADRWTVRYGEAAAWRVPESARAYVGTPPTFEVRSFAAPETVTKPAGETAEVTLAVTVANTGDAEGTFLVELGSRAVSDAPEQALAVTPGETATAEASVTVPPSLEAGERVTVYADWGADVREREVLLRTD
jgi:hypothetical protein